MEFNKVNNGVLKASKSFFGHEVVAEDKYAEVLVNKPKTIKREKGAGKNKYTTKSVNDVYVSAHIYEVDVEQFNKEYKEVESKTEIQRFVKIGE
jgi:hypothetical protein